MWKIIQLIRKLILAGSLCIASVTLAFSGDNQAINQARILYKNKEFLQVLSQLEQPASDRNDERQRLILRGLSQVWLKQWDGASDAFFQSFKTLTKPPEIDASFPKELQQGARFDEFRSLRFHADDMRYLWRVLWMDRIASRITADIDDPFEKAIVIFDYVYRHTQFGVSNKVEDIRDKPFNVLLRGGGLCEELAWILNQLLRSAGVESLRLVLFSDQARTHSPHTISLVRVGEQWIPFDAALGLVFKKVRSSEQILFPDNFLLNPTPEQIKQFGSEIKPIDQYLKSIANFYEDKSLIKAFRYAQPASDYELETHAPRFQVLAQLFDGLIDLPMMARPFLTVVAARTDGDSAKIGKWVPVRIPYIYDMTHELNSVRRQLAQRFFADLEPVEQGSLALLDGDYARADKLFKQLVENKSLSSRARENVDYWSALSMFEQKNYSGAKQKLDQFQKNHPTSRWNNRVMYLKTLMAHAEGDKTKVDKLLESCGQTGDGALFEWVVGNDLTHQ